MSYDLFHVFFYLKKNHVFYLFMLFELILCFTLILIGFDENYTYHERKNVFQVDVNAELISLSNENWFLSDIDFRDTQDSLKVYDMIFGQVYHVDFIDEDGKINNIKIVEANSHFFEIYFGFNAKPNQAYLSDSLSQNISPSDIFLDANISIEKEEEIKWDSKTYELILLKNYPNKIIPTTQFESGDIDIENALFIPIPEAGENLPIYGFLKMKKDNISIRILKELSNILNIKLSSSDLLADFEKGAESQTAFVRLFNWVAWIALFVVIFGGTAMFFLFIENRRKNLKIQHFFGASIGRLRCQIFIELLVVFFVATVISTIIRHIVEPSISSAYYEIQPSLTSFVILIILNILLSYCITVFSTGNSTWELRS